MARGIQLRFSQAFSLLLTLAPDQGGRLLAPAPPHLMCPNSCLWAGGVLHRRTQTCCFTRGPCVAVIFNWGLE